MVYDLIGTVGLWQFANGARMDPLFTVLQLLILHL